MKKIIYSLVALGALTFVSCSDEDKLPTINYKGCQVCEVEGTAPNYIAEDYEVCVAAEKITDSSTVDIAYVDGASTELTPQRYFQLFCDNTYDPDAVGGGNNGGGGGTGGGGSEPGTNCVTCATYTQAGVTVPAQQVCESADGYVVIDGITNNLVTYDQYLTLMNQITSCAP